MSFDHDRIDGWGDFLLGLGLLLFVAFTFICGVGACISGAVGG